MSRIVHYSVVLMAVCGASALGVSLTYVVARKSIVENNQKLLNESLNAVFYPEPLPELGWPGADPERTRELKTPASGTDDVSKIWVAETKEGRPIGVAAIGTAQGYSSKLKVLVAVGLEAGVLPASKPEARIVGVKVLFQQETPGLGANVEKVKATKTLWQAIAEGVGGSGDESAEKGSRDESAEAKRKAITPEFQYEFVGKRYRQLAVTTDKSQRDEKILAMTASTITSKAVTLAVKDAVDKMYDRHKLGGKPIGK